MVCWLTCTKTVLPDSHVTLTPTSQSGNTLLAWGGACAGRGSAPICDLGRLPAGTQRSATASFVAFSNSATNNPATNPDHAGDSGLIPVEKGFTGRHAKSVCRVVVHRSGKGTMRHIRFVSAPACGRIAIQRHARRGWISVKHASLTARKGVRVNWRARHAARTIAHGTVRV
jgi:hypothetical protein